MLTLIRAASLLVACVLTVTCVGVAGAAPMRDPTGHWQGSMGILRLVFHVERRDDGSIAGTVDSPDQGAMGMRLDSLSFDGDSLWCKLTVVGGVYSGRMNATGDTLRGKWSQLGMSTPLALARVSAPSEPPRSQRIVPPYPYDTLAVTIANPNAAGVKLAGTLSVPAGKGPFPAAVLITGSGGQDRDETIFAHRPFRVLADHLTRQGIAVLRLDDRGVGGSTGQQAGATSEDFASDIVAGVDWLAKRPEIAAKRIGLIGHSEGGLIAPLVTSQRKDIAFAVLLAGPGLRGDSLMILQNRAVRRELVSGQDALDREIAVLRTVYAALRSGDSTKLHSTMRELVDLQLASAGAGAGVDREDLVRNAVRQMSSPWFRYFLAHDPGPDLQRVACPVLALNGDRDVQVVAKENLGGIEKALRAGGNQDVTVLALPGLNHLFQTCRTCSVSEYGALEETFAPSALEMISTWIQKRVGFVAR